MILHFLIFVVLFIVFAFVLGFLGAVTLDWLFYVEPVVLTKGESMQSIDAEYQRELAAADLIEDDELYEIIAARIRSKYMEALDRLFNQ